MLWAMDLSVVEKHDRQPSFLTGKTSELLIAPKIAHAMSD
jgi:hypothetical protein